MLAYKLLTQELLRLCVVITGTRIQLCGENALG